jgi:outer membrane receptor protein involved in Fe transport
MHAAWLAASVSSAGFATVAAAEPAEGRRDARPSSSVLEEIIVTAQKREERLQDVPVPVSTISGEILTSTNQLRIEDYQAKIPGVSLALGGNGNRPVIAIRGVTTGGDTNPTVGFVVDDVSYGASVVTGPNVVTPADIDPGDISRVEVLRGPQGTLYGASSIGGLLKFVTVDPSTEGRSGRVEASSTNVHHGSDLGYSARGNVNVPLSDTFAIRASGFTVRNPGYIDNLETGEDDTNEYHSDGGRLSALWRPSDAFSLKLSALIQDSERMGSNDVNTTFGKESFKQSFLTGTGTYHRESDAYSATMVAQLGKVEVTSATGYSIDKWSDSADASTFGGSFLSNIGFANFGFRRVDQQTDSEVKKFSEELRASFPIGDRVTWLVGGFYTKEDTDLFFDNQSADDSGQPHGSIFKIDYGPATYEEYAAFTTLTVGITDRWDIQLGGRYSDHSQDVNLVRSGPVAALFGASPQGLSSDGTAFTYLLTPRFKVSEDLMVYARLASGYRPGAPNINCGAVGVPCRFDADKTQNYDLGLKGSAFGGAFSYDAALYYINWEDIQITGLQAGAFAYSGNVSRATSKGAELTLQFRTDSGFALSAWGAYNDAKLEEAFPPGQIAGRPGDRLPSSPRTSGNLSLDQEFPLGTVATGAVGASFSYIGEREGKFQRTNVPRVTYPSYTTLDAHGGVTYDTWEVRLFVNNALDKRAVLRTGADAALFPAFLTYIQPRTIGVSLSKSF